MKAFKSNYGVSDDITEIIGLSAFPSSAGNYMTLGYPQATPYQVPAGKTLTITGIVFSATTPATRADIIYGDDSVSDGTNAPTNDVLVHRGYHANESNKVYEVGCNHKIPAGKYPAINTATGGAFVHVIGILTTD